MQMTRLRCFMYVSTAYSNSHCMRGSTVIEKLYPLVGSDGQPADPAGIVHHLMQMPRDQAEAEVGVPARCPVQAAVHSGCEQHCLEPP